MTHYAGGHRLFEQGETIKRRMGLTMCMRLSILRMGKNGKSDFAAAFCF